MIRTAPITIVVTARNRSELDPRTLAQSIDHWWDEDGVADMALHRLLGERSTAIDSDMIFSRDMATVAATMTLTVKLDVPEDWTQADLEERLDDWFDVDPDAQAALNRKLGEVTTVDGDVTLERTERVP